MKKTIRIKKDGLQKSEEAVAAEQAAEFKKLKKKWALAMVLSLAGIAIIAAALFWPNPKKPIISTNSVPISAAKDTCPAQNTITYSCYKKELTDITTQQGPEAATALVKSAYTKESYVKSQCHQLMHVVGRAALAKYNNDIAQTYAHGDQFCWSGYYHGAMEELALKKGFSYIIANANSICKPIAAAKGRYSFYDYNCVHGMGHGFMFIKNGDLFASLSACDTLTDNWDRSSCYGGVFMQNIMNEQAPDDSASGAATSAYLKPDQPMYPCTAVAEQYKDSCYLMQTSYALQIDNYDFSKVFAQCGAVEQAFQDTCYTSLGRDASGNSISNVTQTHATCLLGPTEEAQRYCVHGAAMDFVSYFHSDVQAKQLCNSFDANLSSDCLNVVKNYYSTF